MDRKQNQNPNQKGGPMADLKIKPFTFQSTTISIEAISDRGLDFLAQLAGPGACGLEIKKSFANSFIARAESEGLVIK